MATSSKTKTTNSPAKWESRAVAKRIEPGSYIECAECGDQVKFRARIRGEQVICNVYDDGRWDRVEHFHVECYDTAGTPYGIPA